MTRKSKDPAPTSMPLQEQMDQLSTLVEKLEDPSLPLEDALALYEQGVKMANEAQTALEAAEQRIAVISNDDQVQPLEE
ncbi:exodeoxyribonuclease VII, small subunit [Luminiphilus syltensis NOR5-1B]|uniref:Exodeoxyribonuclease 7 small subunit n=1 Tax=Luminiphilus syltensis NOR5-1B TaxID=565045 RepID=B8KWB7_9GAMM|nr:exodeoxyribonuclease VII small subunit [Luminiphilus syltensis]EED34875.1 exodeoxyribonuclease VII, small subunit [Luminiphilus syltensis NOR5-1B]